MTVSSALRYIASSDVKYHVGTTHIAENPFKGTVSWGLYAWNYGEGGQADPTEYNPITGEEYHQRTFCWA